MSIPSLSGSYIDETYIRLVQTTGSGAEFADGLGNPITIGGVTFPYTGSAIITGSLVVTGSTTSTLGFTGSLFGTASWATNAITSSYPITVTGSTLRSVSPEGGVDSSTIDSIFFGNNAGTLATNASQSNFFGTQAGYSASNAYWSNFLGLNAGDSAVNANNSNFLGTQAGNLATNANGSNFIGNSAGYAATNANNSNFLGDSAGFLTTNTYHSNFLGASAGVYATNANYSNFLGNNAGNGATNADHSNFLLGGYQATNAHHSNFIGGNAGNYATEAYRSTFIGFGAGDAATYANNSLFVGQETGRRAVSASYSTLIGYHVGWVLSSNATIKSNNIIIGTNITLPTDRQDSINIGGIIFGTGSYNNTGSFLPFSGSAGGNIGINTVTPTRNFEVSGTVAFPNLTNALYPTVISIDTATGQLYYQAANSGSGIGGTIVVQRNGGTVEVSASILNFTGTGQSTSGGGGIAIIDIPGTETQYTGSTVDTAVTTLNFTGSGVTVTGGAGTTTVEISGGGSGAGFPYTGSAGITGSLEVIGTITHDFNQFNTIYDNVGTSSNKVILTFDPTRYYSCFIEYHVFFYSGEAVRASRAGNIRISVPHNYTSLDGQNNIPFVENTTEYGADVGDPINTTEDIFFQVNYNSGAGKIEVFMFNDNGHYISYINAEYRLIGFKI